jgi:hypothetical protein
MAGASAATTEDRHAPRLVACTAAISGTVNPCAAELQGTAHARTTISVKPCDRCQRTRTGARRFRRAQALCPLRGGLGGVVFEPDGAEVVPAGEADICVEGGGEAAKEGDGGLGAAFLDALDVVVGQGGA